MRTSQNNQSFEREREREEGTKLGKGLTRMGKRTTFCSEGRGRKIGESPPWQKEENPRKSKEQSLGHLRGKRTYGDVSGLVCVSPSEEKITRRRPCDSSWRRDQTHSK